MAGYCDPPNRFSSTNQPTRRRGPSVLAELKKLLNKKISYEDPATHKQVRGTIAHCLAIRHIYNGLQGENNAIVDIMNRIDGKIAPKIQGEMEHSIFIESILAKKIPKKMAQHVDKSEAKNPPPTF